MGLERLSVAVRPRAGWEAIDLGFTMARQWWRPLWLTWLVLYLPAALLLHAMFWDTLWIAMLILWWLHPLFDRAVMHVVGHAVFDSPPTLKQTLGSAGQWLKPGWLAGITFYRINPARSFMLPVWQLEQQRGKVARQRRKLLSKRLRGHGVWLTIVCLIFVVLLFRGFMIIPMLLEPVGAEVDFDWATMFGEGSLRIWDWQRSLCLVLAYSIIEPFYVCGGFALYLNRRATLEGWDIEIALRKLAQRVGHTAAILVACMAIGLSCHSAPTQAQTQTQESSPSETIKKILAEPDFERYREEKRWEYRGTEEKNKSKDEDPALLKGFGQTIARIVQVLIWVGAGIIVFLIVRSAWNHWGWAKKKNEAEGYTPPEALFGLELEPDSLPLDVSAAAMLIARQGQLREALSLLYRGALSALIHRKQVRLAEGDTEGDCLGAASAALPSDSLQYFSRLVDAWRGTAYAKKLPLPEHVEQLCVEWNAHFRVQESAL